MLFLCKLVIIACVLNCSLQSDESDDYVTPTSNYQAEFVTSDVYEDNAEDNNRSTTINFSSGEDKDIIPTLTETTYSTCYNCTSSLHSSTSSYNLLTENSREDSSESTDTKVKIVKSTTNLLCSKCNNSKPKIVKFDYYESNDKINVSWYPLQETLDVCKFKYEINRTSINSIIPYFRIEKNYYHVFENLKPCEKYHVIVKAINHCSFEDVYETTVFSEPEHITELFIDVSNDNTVISWPQANSDYCSKYKVYMNQQLYETEENEYTLKGNLFCQQIGVQTIREDNKAGEFTYKSVPGSVQNLKADDTTPEQISITWEPPVDDFCVTDYKLQIFDGTHLYYNTTLNATTHHFLAKKLESCLKYDIRIAAVSQTATGKYEFLTMNTKIPDIRHEVGNPKLKYNQLKNQIEISWDPPEKQGHCITNYKLIVWDDDKTMDNKFDVKKNTSFILQNVTGCTTYNTIIKAQMSMENEISTDILSLKIPPILPKAPESLQIHREETSATLSFKIETKKENNCELQYFKYKCLAFEDFEWIIREKSDFQELSDEAGPIISINITDLSEFTTYTCTASINNTAGFSDVSEVNFTTLPAAPSKPENFSVCEIESDIFDLSWLEPRKIPGILKTYKLSITPVEPIHYIPNDCLINEESKEFIFDSSTFHYNLKARSNFKYSSAISAETILYGEENILEFNTSSGVPEKVREFNKTFNISNDDDGFTLMLSWLYPCDSKGEIDYFLILLNGTDKKTLPPDRRKEIVRVNDDIEDINYSIEFKNITPLFNYSVSIAAVLTDGTNGEQEIINFLPPSLPNRPENFTVKIYSDSINLSWSKPSNIPEDLNSYKLNITSIEPLHFIPKGCDVKQESIEEILNGSTLYFNHKMPLPNYKYFSIISAETLKYGEEKKIEFNTKSGVPEKVREFKHTLDISNTSEVSFILTWDHPCNSHGEIQSFLIELNGTDTEGMLDPDVRQEEVNVHKDLQDIHYTIKINDTRPFYNYSVSIVAVLTNNILGERDTNKILGKKETIYFKSPDGFPSSPINVTSTNIYNDSFYITWSAPLQPNGKLINYKIFINCVEPMHEVPSDCNTHTNNFSYEVSAAENRFKFIQAQPHYLYEIFIAASTSAGYGNKSDTHQLITKPAAPQSIRNLTYYIKQLNSSNYEANVTVVFDPPCHLNGNLSDYIVELRGTNKSHTHKETEAARNSKYEFQLRPDYLYNISVVVVAFDRSEPERETFTSPSGVPPFKNASSRLAEVYDGNATIILDPDLFENDCGDIMYYAILVCSASMYNKSDNFGFWNGNDWPEIGNWTNDSDAIPEYQATPIKWNPFQAREGATARFTLGAGDCIEYDVCNGPLRPNTQYVVQIRGFTKNAYRDDGVSYFTTLPEDFDKTTSVMLVAGIVGGCLGALIVISLGIFYILRRRQPKIIETVEENTNLYPQPISIGKFPQYFRDLTDKPYILKTEFVNLNNKSAEQELPTTYALLTENRKKNRYINILPYDDRRVILQNDDSDYINASYIDGYSNSVEYLATQGPLETTLHDFWRMIFDEDVAVIVMVAQFVEQKKDKCYKYIPNKQEEMEIDDENDEMKVRCTTELKFDYYCERQLTIQKDGKQRKIVHLQFMDWPDFGCPDGTENMLDFCCTIRRHMNAAMGKIVVHCSAGVGRTGTLIATDILLQAINDNKDVDVFNTVLDLRKQRKNMVQTEAQYIYIYSCINDAIINPPSLKEIKATEPIYENVNDIEMKILKSDDNENIEEKE